MDMYADINMYLQALRTIFILDFLVIFSSCNYLIET